MELKQKQTQLLVYVGDASKVWCYKEQYGIGLWNIMSMKQGKLEVTINDKSEYQHSMNQRTKMDWKGRI